MLNELRRWWLVVSVGLLTWSVHPWCSVAQDAAPQSTVGVESLEGQEPILEQLAKGLQLIQRQVAEQQQQLKAATTDRERQLIRDHLSFLRKEQRVLEDIVEQLAGPQFDARSAAQEQHDEQQYERQQKILERNR